MSLINENKMKNNLFVEQSQRLKQNNDNWLLLIFDICL
jgi:hypothetical protein